jgi:hypothetical protein
MKILLSCLQSLCRHDIPAYEFWRAYFVEGAKEAGHQIVEVPEVDWAEGLTYAADKPGLDAWRTRTWEKTLAYAEKENATGAIDFFLGYLYPEQIDEAAVKQLQQLGIPCVNFFCDNVREFHQVPTAYRPFDLHWVPEFEALPMYRRARLPHLNLPMPCWVDAKWRTAPETSSEEPATFIGSADVLRQKLLGDAMAAGADFFVRGPGWRGAAEQARPAVPLHGRSRLVNQVGFLRRHGCRGLMNKFVNRIHPVSVVPIREDRILEPVFGAAYFEASRAAQVAIGINRVPTARRPLHFPLSYSRLRDIEAPMLGACYLTEWTKGLECLYEPGVEVECYHTAAELAEKLQMLASQPARRAELRRRAQRRALQDHSVGASLRKIASELGGRTL